MKHSTRAAAQLGELIQNKKGEGMDQKPLSENIGVYEAGGYIVTAGIWRTNISGELYDTFEIGIRQKETDKFHLLQGDFNYQSVQEVAEAISQLLSIETLCFTPEWCLEHFK